MPAYRHYKIGESLLNDVISQRCCLHHLWRRTSNYVADSNSNVSSSTRHRTHKCGQLSRFHAGEMIKLSGWLEHKRGNRFFTMKDSSGTCQVLTDVAIKLPKKESVIQVEGRVRLRPEGSRNTEMPTGDIEIHASKIDILNECTFLPFPVNDYSKSREELRMKYRYIDIRGKQLQHNLRLRSRFLLEIRKFLCEKRGFVDVETPTLFRRTPGGAQEFVVPTQKPGKFYSLPQSPQQFKQLLMAGGIDRYMQIAKCYRDENTKPERQPEFTQLDMELSFTCQEELKEIIEEMLMTCWPSHLPALQAPFQRMSYNEAMEKYGLDKPDTRFEWLIDDITAELMNVSIFKDENNPNESLCVKALRIPGGSNLLSKNQVKDIRDSVQKLMSIEVGVVNVTEHHHWDSPLVQFIPDGDIPEKVNMKMDANPGDMILLCGHKEWQSACQALGKCRTLAASKAIENGHPLFEDGLFKILWIEEFPLFEYENETLMSAHHPFTAPVDEDLHLLYVDPRQVRGQHYDLVLNGSEIGGGSIRIHDANLQKYVLESVLNVDSSQMQHLLDALNSGCPPHGGIALGIDRLLAIMCGCNSIRDVIAFPKSSEGADLMSGAPCSLEESDLRLYNLSVKT